MTQQADRVREVVIGVGIRVRADAVEAARTGGTAG